MLNWLDDRTGYKGLLRGALYEHIPGGARWRYVWGSTLVFVFAVQMITGVFLWMHYSPSSQTAWESVYYIQHEMTGGWLLRGIHHFAAQIMIVLLALFASGVDHLAVLAALLFVGYGFVGLVIPSTSVLAMDDHGEIAGTASALLGTLQFAIGAVAMGVSGVFFDGTPLPMVVGIALCAVIAFTLAQVSLGRVRRSAELPAE